MTTLFRSPLSCARDAVVGIAVLALAGCAGGTADVAGTVTFQGKPVVFGSVVMIGPDRVPKSGVIRPDGTFRVEGVKVGAAKVTVSSPPPPGAAQAPARKGGRDTADNDKILVAAQVDPEVAKGWFPIPDKYADPERSGLTADVKAGYPVDLALK